MKSRADLNEILDATYRWSREREFKGYNKHDALNSPVVRLFMGWTRWLRIIAIQVVMRLPFNVRPLLLTKKTYNPKGLALFISGLVDRYRAGGGDIQLERAIELEEILESQRCRGDWSGYSWGYHYAWQDLNFYVENGVPNAVVTVFVCEAYLDLYEVTKDLKYFDIASQGITFLTQDLPTLYRGEEELCLSYVPLQANKARVMDVSILIAALLERHGCLGRSDLNKDTARKLVNYVVRRQTEEGAWFYTDPPERSPIRHDNYHTGFILDALNRYRSYAETAAFDSQFSKGLAFYREHLFNEDSSPRWMSDQSYPHDVHGAAQGLLSFSEQFLSNRAFLDSLSSWLIVNLYSGNGRFYYQKLRWFTKRVTYMRWCNAWAFRALARYDLSLYTAENNEKPTDC